MDAILRIEMMDAFGVDSVSRDAIGRSWHVHWFSKAAKMNSSVMTKAAKPLEVVGRQHLIQAVVEIVAGRSCQRRRRDEQAVLLRSLTIPIRSAVRVIDTPKLETACTAMQSNSSINQCFSTGC